MKDDRGEIELPDRLIREFAICLLPDVVAYCTSDRGKREFAEWKKAQEAKKGKSEVDEKESKAG